MALSPLLVLHVAQAHVQHKGQLELSELLLLVRSEFLVDVLVGDLLEVLKAFLEDLNCFIGFALCQAGEAVGFHFSHKGFTFGENSGWALRFEVVEVDRKSVRDASGNPFDVNSNVNSEGVFKHLFLHEERQIFELA